MVAMAKPRPGMTPPIPEDERVRSAGLGQLVVSVSPEEVLVAYGLGSCVGVVGYDAQKRVAGLLHALLPQHRNGEENLAKFVDTGVPLLLQEMERMGALRRSITWYVVGGAQMLRLPGASTEFNIGAKNAEMAQLVMAREGLTPKAVDTGGNSGRTVKVRVRDGTVTVRTLGQSERRL